LLDDFFPVLLLTVTVTLQVPFLTAFRVVPNIRHILRDVALTFMMTFNPVHVAIYFADKVFFIVSVVLIASVLEATGTGGVVADTVVVVTFEQIPPVFATVSF